MRQCAAGQLQQRIDADAMPVGVDGNRGQPELGEGAAESENVLDADRLVAVPGDDGGEGWDVSHLGAGLEDRVVELATEVRGGFLRVVIGGEALAGLAGGALDGVDAVEADVVGFEHDAAVEQRGYAVLAALDVTVPQLEVAAVLLLPVLVQVDNQV